MPALTLRQHLGDRPLGRRARRPLHRKGRIVQADHPLVVLWSTYNPYWIISPAATRSGRQRGTVKSFDGSYGVVAPDGGIPDKDDVFASESGVVDRVDCGLFRCGYPKSLTQGERVEYDWARDDWARDERRGWAKRIRRVAWRRILAQDYRDDFAKRLRLPEAEEVFSFLGCGGSYEHDATRTRQQQAWALVEKVCATVEATRVFDETDSFKLVEAKGLLRAGGHYARRVHHALTTDLRWRHISHGMETIDDPRQVRYLQTAHPHAPQTTPARAGASEAKRRRPLAA